MEEWFNKTRYVECCICLWWSTKKSN